MPYFERRPWQEQVSHSASAVAKAQADELGMASIARSILVDETASKQDTIGPFRCKSPLRPGEEGVVSLELSAPSTGGPVSIQFMTTDLTSSAGGRIQVSSLWVNPEKLAISPGGVEILKVSLQVPNDTAPGLYGGRIAVDGTDPLSLFVEFEIIPRD